MDPNTTLAAIGYYLGSGDHEALNDAVEALVEWLRKGGFRPTNIDAYPDAWRVVWLSM